MVQERTVVHFNKQRMPGEEPRFVCEVSSGMELAGKLNRAGCSCSSCACRQEPEGGEGVESSTHTRKSAAVGGAPQEYRLALLTPEALENLLFL